MSNYEGMTAAEIATAIIEEEVPIGHRAFIADVVAAAEQAGISRRTLTRISREMGVEVIEGGPRGGYWQRG